MTRPNRFGGRATLASAAAMLLSALPAIRASAVGFAFSTQRIMGDGRSGAPGIAIDSRQTDGFVKVAGKWTLVHQHLSVPFDPATGQAILTAK